MRKLLAVAGFCLFSTAVAIAGTAEPVFQMRLVENKPSADTVRMTDVTSNLWVTQDRYHTTNVVFFTNVLYVQKRILLDQTALQSAKAGTNGLGKPTLWITFTAKGAKEFAHVTRQNIHKRLAIIINGRLCEAPIIQREISGGEAHVDGSFNNHEVADLAKKINDTLAKK